jgi:hypothetical protein
MKIKFLIISMVLWTVFPVTAQEIDYPNLDSLVRAVTILENEIYEVKLNLHQSQKQLKTGILVATVGYSVTILGGQLLGSNPDLGKALLYAGGAIGITGTVVLVKGFNKISIGPPRRPKYYGK